MDISDHTPGAGSRSSGPASDRPWTEEGHVRVLGGNLHYVGCGSGEAVVLLPKMGGWVADWRHIAPLLAEHYRVIAIDPPGYGDSVMDGEPPYVLTIEESAAAIASVLNTLGVDRYYLVGNSLGGDIGLSMALTWPNRLRRLVLISCSLGPPMSLPELRERDERNFYSGFDANDRALPKAWEDVIPGWFIERSHFEESNASRAQSGAWLKPSSRSISHADFPEWLSRVKAPTLLIHGEQGHFANYEATALAALENGRAVRTPGACSFPHQEFPRETADILHRFFSEE